ncbi:MAG: tetratricopeptide repeat protein [Alphaproteobacteria bacterium]|nr:tetratricopeptide repeat protein [Alphaproteobacteria bacterium]
MDDPRQILAAALSARQSGDLGSALTLGRRLAAVLPDEPAVHGFLGEVLTDLGDTREAMEAFVRATELAPSDAGLRRAAALLAVAAGRPEVAAGQLGVLAAMGEETPDDLANRADALAAAGKTETAIASYEKLLTHWPDSVDVMVALSSLLIQTRRSDEAEPLLRKALAINPDDVGALTNLSLVLLMRGEADAALALGRRAAALPTADVAALLALAKSEHRLGHAVAALEAAGRAESLAKPGDAYVADTTASMLTALGRVDEALERLRLALDTPQDIPPSIRSSVLGKLLFCLQYQPDLEPARMVDEARKWSRAAAEVVPLRPRAATSWDPGRRLKIGYVSADFREHACAYLIEPIIRHHDRSVVEVHCYAEVPVEDAVTRRIRADADHWLQTTGLDDATLVDAIRSDGIDVLVDLSGHTSDNRLLVFAHRPAPVQVATLIGYAATTGVAAFDCLLGDPYLTPPGCEEGFSEPIHRLPRIIAPFLPRGDWSEPASEAPADIVFACVSDPARVDGGTIALWERLLEAVPGSRILTKHNLFDDPAAREGWRQKLGAISGKVDVEGIPGGWAGNMDVYARSSVVLDPPRHSGGTSVLIPLWMGVPVVALSGRNSWQRTGATILANAGLPDLIARDEQEYVAIAARLATDRPRLDRLRRDLREQMRRSPVCDAPLVVGDIEAAYRSLWREACARYGS